MWIKETKIYLTIKKSFLIFIQYIYERNLSLKKGLKRIKLKNSRRNFSEEIRS